MKIAGCQPDSGNPTVRDERGAYGNVSYGGIRNPLHKLKRCMSETLCLRLRAPYFYPTLRPSCIRRFASPKATLPRPLARSLKRFHRPSFSPVGPQPLLD